MRSISPMAGGRTVSRSRGCCAPRTTRARSITASTSSRPDAAASGNGKSRKRSVQGEAGLGVTQLAGFYEGGARHLHRMQLALDIADPEFEEAAENRILRRQVHVLPDEALQQARMIRQVIEDFRRGQAIVDELQAQIAHGPHIRNVALTFRQRC